MIPRPKHLSRRRFLTWLGGASLLPLLPGVPAGANPAEILTRPIPSSGEALPVIGMGTWLTFDVGENRARRDDRTQVLRTFFEHGGQLVDSSPMYGSAEAVLGHALEQIPSPPLFSATKVWTWGQRAGESEMERSRQLWGVGRFDLMQVHNLLDWEAHLETLLRYKQEGRIRYLGMTTSHGRRHDTLERIMLGHDLDFVQFTYNMLDREAEDRLLPLARERGIAVIINRPFQRGGLFRRVEGRPLPGWGAEIGCETWAQAFLKFIVSHPAVTCAIPATTRVEHMMQNMGAAYGALPDEALRRRMLVDFNVA
ncbi:aldo/keto reductase [Thioalkalivibrio sulfidiphilus HL-EbGr7]|uniref:Aldo/keto reductase n=1 Tax=Thioalkalivibrio sulfidiphilus (strain HL-EbGR7) TaxID=396588 RepID=B8GPI5_THISH|nr:aldo/keto reductase [Thioalkalivibrio sulfidiphilus]ACL72152.1 aldo/keto reductase [Thioalkalivibrio sulfidiphilus HL-EbGr7]